MKGHTHETFDLHIIQLMIVFFRLIVLIFGVALITNLYTKAMAFEKNHAAMDVEKKAFYDTIEEINTQINELYNELTNESEYHSN